jgi:hypothetical protein
MRSWILNYARAESPALEKNDSVTTWVSPPAGVLTELEKFFIMKTVQFRLTKLLPIFALFALPLLLATSASAVDTLPILWQAGGQSSGNDSAGQAVR